MFSRNVVVFPFFFVFIGFVFRHSYDCVYVGAGCDPDLTLPYLKGLLNVGGVMIAPFREELVRMEVGI